MSSPVLMMMIVLLVLLVLCFAPIIWLVYRALVIPRPWEALVVTGAQGLRVTFERVLVIPVLHRVERMDMRMQQVRVEFAGAHGLICEDNIRADLEAVFYLRVNPMEADILNVARSVGCDRAADPAVLQGLFGAKFSEALKTVAKQCTFRQLHKQRDLVVMEVLDVIGRDLGGYIVEDLAIVSLEQTPLEQLDDGNILDAEGIRKATEIISQERKTIARLRKELWEAERDFTGLGEPEGW